MSVLYIHVFTDWTVPGSWSTQRIAPAPPPPPPKRTGTWNLLAVSPLVLVPADTVTPDPSMVKC